MSSLGPDRCRTLVASARVGRLATVTDEGRPHLVPCCFALIDETLWSVVDGKPKSSTQLRRLDNIRSNPVASLLVDHYADDWTELWWVRADGSARLVLPDDPTYEPALDELAAKYAQYRADRPAGPMVAIDIDRWSGWAYAD